MPPDSPDSAKQGQSQPLTRTADTVLGAEDLTGPRLCRGTSLDRYIVLDVVGEGGMSVVYKAYDPDLDRAVAIKLLRTAGADLGGGEPGGGRLIREAQALARLSHPNVVNVFDVGTYRGAVFLAMELVEGHSLRSWCEAEPRTREQILRVFLAAGGGLAAAHHAGLVHRDFKPDNVMIGADQRVRVLDFGLVRAGEASPVATPGATVRPSPPPADHEQIGASGASGSQGTLRESLTQMGAVLGTPRYMSPEQHLGGEVDARSDQFSFCVSLYEALYGVPPFAGDTPEGLRANVVAGRLAPAPAGSRVPRRLRQVLLRGLAVSPAERFPSMDALIAALRQAARRRGRMGIWIGAAALLAAAAAAGWAQSRQRQSLLCRGADTELAGAWDAARRAAVERAFLATGAPIAREALRGTARTLDAYAAAWASMHRETCEATRVRGTQSQELLDLRMACLDDRLAVLRSLTELYVHADAKLVERAAQAAQALPGLVSCADAVSLRSPTPAPRDAAARQRVEDLRRQLASARALGLAGRTDAALGIVRTVLVQAPALSYPRVESEAQLQLGQLLEDRGEYPDSGGGYQAALTTAVAARDWEASARAAIGLAGLLGLRQGQHREAERWYGLAEAYISQLQRRDELLGLLYSMRSELRIEEARYDAAYADVTRALEIQKRVLGEDHLDLARSYCSLARVEWYRARYPEALAGFRRCLAIQQRVLGQDHPIVVESMVSIGDALGDNGEHERAIAEYQDALAMIQRVQPDHPFTARIFNNMGKDYLALGRPREALEHFARAFEVNQRKSGSPFNSVFFLNNMGAAELALGKPEEALRYLTQALDLARHAPGANDRATGLTLSTMGEAYRKSGRPVEALAQYHAALRILEKAFGKAHPDLAEPLLGIGIIELGRHATASARAALERALAIVEPDPGDGQQLADIRFALAQALWQAGKRPQALALATQARGFYLKAPGKSLELAIATRWLARRDWQEIGPR